MGWAERKRPVFKPLEIRTGPPTQHQMAEAFDGLARAVNAQADAILELRGAYTVLEQRAKMLEEHTIAFGRKTPTWVGRLRWLVTGR